MSITGPHYTIGAACAAGNAGLIQGAQMLMLGECDLRHCGRSLREHSARLVFLRASLARVLWLRMTNLLVPVDHLTEIVMGLLCLKVDALYTLERLSDARKNVAQKVLWRVGWLRDDK